MSEQHRGFVVVTGASTGIGYTTALELDKLGFTVFAGVRKSADGERLAQNASKRLRTIMLDVTDDDEVKAAVSEIALQTGEAGLAGLVNNAGIAVAGPLEFIPMERFKQQFEVNVFGVLRVTQPLIPLLRKARGRIINISSIGGRSSAPVVGPYAASKFALEAITDALRVELHKWGIYVSAIEPGAIKTPIWEKGAEAADDLERDMPPEAMTMYGNLFAAMRSIAKQHAKNSTPPEEVAQAIIHALTADPPKPRYLVGTDAKIRIWLERLPTRMRDNIIRKRVGG
jgi:NAD(P)-dependent dehydrogenase (short-subunit alcohol dehydrogenase family)